ncbi:MAG: AAA family ATPase [Bacteroidales bacterium]|nr:AAA family ATPase [Bacteroidales bacterium]
MAFYLEKAIFVNRAPLEHIELDFKKDGINVLSAINGNGKTTILSHITDAFFELAKKVFHNEFEGKENKYYRVSSSLFNINLKETSFVYFRFKLNGENVDYIDIRNKCTEEQYNSAIVIEYKIPFSTINREFADSNNIKLWSLDDNNKIKKEIFAKSILTYFPSYRYETPSYLNEPYNIKLDYAIKTRFTGYLQNQIEVVSDMPSLVNWFLDVLLDLKLHEETQLLKNGDSLIPITIPAKEKTFVWDNLNKIVSSSLSSKRYTGEVRLGIGSRNSGSTRISIMNDIATNEMRTICPSIFNLSAGELSLISIFGEVLHQADNIQNNIQLKNINGIVLIDEVDKHLHITLQKEVLPKLFNLFPNVQFIVSSHSPFLNMGLADEAMERTQIIDLDNNGIVCEPTNNDLYKEVYEMMINENQRFADRYKNLLDQIKMNAKPIIITEGKTDYRHIKKAMSVLERNDIDVDFYQVPDNWGSSELKGMLESLSRIKQQRIVIGIFDRDEPNYLSYLDVENQQYKSYGDSNVYAFAIPLVNEDIYGDSISIEHYYNRNNLLKEDPVNHRRLFLGSEFHPSGNSKDANYQTKISKIKRKVEVNGVIDEKVYMSTDLEQLHSIALTKDAFTTLIETDDGFIQDFDFSNFNLIIDVIRDISNRPLYN